MSLYHLLPMYFPFLDVAFGPSFSMGEVDPVTKVIVIIVLLFFLAFIGYLIWKSLRKKDN